MTRIMPTGHMRDWEEEVRQRVVDLACQTYLEFCALDPQVSVGVQQTTALKNSCRTLGLVWWGWPADRVMAGLFNRFYLLSANSYVSPRDFVERATDSDRDYAGEELCKFAQFRATHGWTPIGCNHISPSYH